VAKLAHEAHPQEHDAQDEPEPQGLGAGHQLRRHDEMHGPCIDQGLRLQGMHLGCVEVAKLYQDQFPRIVQSDRDVQLLRHIPPTPPERLCGSAGSALEMPSPV
jgi:hypothetical protein